MLHRGWDNLSIGLCIVVADVHYHGEDSGAPKCSLLHTPLRPHSLSVAAVADISLESAPIQYIILWVAKHERLMDADMWRKLEAVCIIRYYTRDLERSNPPGCKFTDLSRCS